MYIRALQKHRGRIRITLQKFKNIPLVYNVLIVVLCAKIIWKEGIKNKLILFSSFALTATVVHWVTLA